MPNELIIIISLILCYCCVVAAYLHFGTYGLFGWTVFATITANIEVLILIDAFGMEQTLGNVLFASTFLVTDILSEIEGEKEAKKAVNLGIATSLAFIVVSQLWLVYTPNANDWVFGHMKAIFSNTPRILIAGFLVYAIAQKFDVWVYHKIWRLTEKRCGNAKKYLWIRNNASTLISQFLNSILFTIGAFGSSYDFPVLINIIFSSYIIFVFTSLADTPAVYLARYLKTRRES